MQINEFLSKIHEKKPNNQKLNQVILNKFLQEEINLIIEIPKCLDYYVYLISNIELDKSNKINSYIMWIYDKVDNLDQNNPIKYTKQKISLPDVDLDFESNGRDTIIQYLRDKYGQDKVSHIITLGQAQGRGALKDVLRAHGACSFDEMNRMTEYIPDEAAISDELQTMKEEDKENGGDGDASIIRWSLENNGEFLKQWAYLDEKGKICGPYAQYFEQAIRLEGTKKSQGKHASGVVVSNDPLSEICPMVRDSSSDELICGLVGEDLEKLGMLKLDVLSVSVFSKIHKINDLLAGTTN